MNLVLDYVSEASKKNILELQKEISSMGGRAIAVQADVSKEAECKKLVSSAVKEFGSIYLLANNAGVYSAKPGTPTWELTEQEFDRIFATNTKGIFFMAKHCGKWMIDNKVKGAIVNTGSVAGLDASTSSSIYGASKAAVHGFTKTWAVEFAKYGVRVNAVAPGAVLTDLLKDVTDERKNQFLEQTPLRELATTQDIAEAVVFLAKHPKIVGQTLVVDGGRLRH
jgi:3-oxoacyl-[acyl-carrier protein] reductase